MCGPRRPLRGSSCNNAGLEQLVEGFERLRLEHIPSHSNFVCLAIPRTGPEPRADAVFQTLLRQGVIVRPLGGYQMPDHLRITVGLPTENERFLDALAHALRA